MSQSFTLPPRWANHKIRICLVGAGGTGSQLADQLASMDATLRLMNHPGFDVVVWDGDVVGRSNLGRQRYVAADIGLNKARVLVHRIRLFYGVDWDYRSQNLAISKTDFRGDTCDLLITAVDKARFRARLGQHYRHKYTETLWGDVGNGASTGQAVIGHLGRTSHPTPLPNVYQLYPELRDMAAEDREQPSCSTEEALRRQDWPVNRVAALTLVDLLWALITKGSIKTHGAYFRLNPMRVEPLPIDPKAWAMLGYKAPRRRSRKATGARAKAGH